MHQNKGILGDTLKSWLPLAVAIIIVSGLAYAAVQQNYRQSANDPQIQIAEDVAEAITQGTPAESIVPPTGNTDLRKSLAVFLMIYDDSNKLVGSSAILDGKNPEYPSGVLDSVKKKGQESVTWQPTQGVRIASVTKHYSGEQSGFVVVGRSLREVEKRVKQLTAMTAIATALALVLSLLLIFLFKKTGRGNSGQHDHGHHEHAEIIFDSSKEN